MSLQATAQALVAPGKGILAADESLPTIARRLTRIGIESTEEVRRDYRDLLVSTPGLAEHISGVILFDETIRQHQRTGTPFAEGVLHAGVLPGIKVDAGTTPLPRFADEVVTQGLDGLAGRLAEYASLGARFAKWRAVLAIGPDRPSRTCIEEHASALARYAATAQEHGLVPIVEPEVLMDGDHSLDRCAVVTRTVLRAVYDQLVRHRVELSGTLLKPNMVLPGAASGQVVPDTEIAEATIAVLRDSVPASVPGVVFLSGGQTPQQATARLNALNRCAPQPWQLSFSFGRALQAPVLDAWAGLPQNRSRAQDELLRRARLNGLARSGRWSAQLEPTSPLAS